MQSCTLSTAATVEKVLLKKKKEKKRIWNQESKCVETHQFERQELWQPRERTSTIMILADAKLFQVAAIKQEPLKGMPGLKASPEQLCSVLLQG